MTEPANDVDATTDDVELDDDEAQALLAGAVQETDREADQQSARDDDSESRALRTSLDKARREAQNLRTRLREIEPLASKAKTAEDRLSDLEQKFAAQGTAYEEANEKRLEANKKRALSQVYAELADAGLKKTDVREILEGYDPSVLLKDGEPNDDAITKLAKSLAKVAGRVPPDHDQGRKGGTAPPDMNTLIRRAAGISLQ